MSAAELNKTVGCIEFWLERSAFLLADTTLSRGLRHTKTGKSTKMNSMVNKIHPSFSTVIKTALASGKLWNL